MAGEHFSTIADRDFRQFDKALELRDGKAAAISATTSETAIAVPLRKSMDFKVVVYHSDITAVVAGTAEWVLNVEVASTQGGTYTSLGTITLTATGQTRERVFGRSHVKFVNATQEWVRITATKVGTPGNLTYGAFITCAE